MQGLGTVTSAHQITELKSLPLGLSDVVSGLAS